MSDTPRTDKAEYEVRLGRHRRMVVRPQLARELERELQQEREDNEDMRDLLREVYNLTQLERDCPIDLPHRALVHIGHLIEEKTPPRRNEAGDPP